MLDPFVAYHVRNGEIVAEYRIVMVQPFLPESALPEREPEPLPEPEPRPFLTPVEAAEILDVHDETVRRWIADGTLHEQKYHGVWAIKKADVWRLRGERVGNTLRGPGMRAIEVHHVD